MLNYIPVVGWITCSIFYTFLSVPLYFLWNWLVPMYLPMLPEVWQQIPFWNIWGIVYLVSLVKFIVYPACGKIDTSKLKEGLK